MSFETEAFGFAVQIEAETAQVYTVAAHVLNIVPDIFRPLRFSEFCSAETEYGDLFQRCVGYETSGDFIGDGMPGNCAGGVTRTQRQYHITSGWLVAIETNVGRVSQEDLVGGVIFAGYEFPGAIGPVDAVIVPDIPD